MRRRLYAPRRRQADSRRVRSTNGGRQAKIVLPREKLMTPPTWLDASGRPTPRLACWTCGREVAPMRFRAADLRPHGWRPPQTLQIPDWCGCSTEYLPVPVADG